MFPFGNMWQQMVKATQRPFQRKNTIFFQECKTYRALIWSQIYLLKCTLSTAAQACPPHLQAAGHIATARSPSPVLSPPVCQCFHWHILGAFSALWSFRSPLILELSFGTVFCPSWVTDVILTSLKLFTWDQISSFFFFLLILFHLFTQPLWTQFYAASQAMVPNKRRKQESQVHSDKGTTELLIWHPAFATSVSTRVYKTSRFWSFGDLVSSRLSLNLKM